MKDCAEAIARLQLAATLNHRTYNVATGPATTNGELVAAIKTAVPDFPIALPDGRDPHGPARDTCLDTCLDTGRIQRDVGYQPAYDTERVVADYVNWLRAGNVR